MNGPTTYTRGTDHTPLVIPPEVVETARRSIGAVFPSIGRANPEENVQGFLDPSRAFKRAEVFEKYVSIRSKKLPEIGSGFGGTSL